MSGWTEAMRAGDFARAWTMTDHDLAALALVPKHTGPRHLQRIWRGEELANKRVLVRCYHGLGDTIQFLRFMPALGMIARSVTVWCQPELLPLVERIEGVSLAIPLHDGTPGTEFDADIEIMEVPHAIRARRETVEMRAPYLVLPPREAAAGQLQHCQDLAVGLVWEVGAWDKRRAVPPALLRRLAGDGRTLYSLQRGGETGRLPETVAGDISTPDIVALGHLIRQVDLVISVDTMVAHLAGALGCEAWVLLHADCDWRWPTSGSRTFWYPTLRLFRQRTQGNWDEVIEEVRQGLLVRAELKRRAG
ncbi:glycosyltransferase family 9 protein [Bradyrhizobium sp. 5.13L]